MKRYAILLVGLLSFGSSAQADLPPLAPSWVPLMPVSTCTVDTEDEGGYCRIFLDMESGTHYLVFWDSPNDIKWIRSGTRGEYDYFYQRPRGTAL